MLHEILLSLSGHPSSLLCADDGSAGRDARGGDRLTPAERDLLASAAHLSSLHIKLRGHTLQISANHPSMVCRAVATTIDLVHLEAFQRKVLGVERKILQEDADVVGAYNIVSLTAVMSEFTPWRRRLEWLSDAMQFMLKGDGGNACTAAQLIDRLRKEIQSGYTDIEEAAHTLVKSAEMAWLKQASAWILYGRLPSLGQDEFFIKASKDENGVVEYALEHSQLPSFVSPATAASMLFIGRCLNHARVKSTLESGLGARNHVAGQLQELSSLTFPLDSASFSRAITSIRLSLSRNTLQKLLPLEKVVEILQLLRDYFLLVKGEFAMCLTQEADEKSRSRWRRADNLAYEKKEGLTNVVVKQGEVTRVLARAWAAMGSMQGLHADEDEGAELARDLLRLQIGKASSAIPLPVSSIATRATAAVIAATPFRNLLFSVPVTLTLCEIPSPLDMFLTPSDLQVYTAVNAYLLSVRRAHIRLTDLWKMTSLRRHHPAPLGPPTGSTRAGRERVILLRERQASRSLIMRSAWVACSAAVFFLAETEAYMQSEVLAGLWEDYRHWLLGDPATSASSTGRSTRAKPSVSTRESESDDDGDIWLETPDPAQPAGARFQQHDPESLSTAHRIYLRSLCRHLLLTQPSYTEPLYSLLVHIDQLVALIRRLHSIWEAMDLETDAGVVDAFVDLERDEREVIPAIRVLEGNIRTSISDVIAALRALEMDTAFAAELEGDTDPGLDDYHPHAEEAGGGAAFVPPRIGGINHLLMKLDFGGWIGGPGSEADSFLV
ncbi:hypothetical protein jhhlp_003458 [Lomentospora prolificans]|uniref:Spindle pole body component n=1 Tax=Lomentospora prolificans TaxID=41688 RepID=A0A2N3N8T2_9PEZI|nr:hypothetical protein jhhlp_003458 [Lomentospora prolificans]